MKYAIEDTTLTAIGNAVRAKGETTELIKVSDLADAIINLPSGGGGGIEVEPIVLEGDQSRGCSSKIAENYIKLFGDTISTSNITNCSYMFNKYQNDIIPFDINCKSGSNVSLSNMFYLATLIKQVPRIMNARPSELTRIFDSCLYIREMPDDFFDTWDWSYLNSYKYAGCNSTFSRCYSLRKIPTNFLKNAYSAYNSYSSNIYYEYFFACSSLDEINGLVVVPMDFTSNMLRDTFNNCYRLKDMTFETNEDGTPKTANWKSQVIDLSKNIGYTDNSTKNNILNYNSGITADKEVIDDATYQALKNDPDWFSTKLEYSRYNHNSAVNTINSLPDTSANGGTNTIKFNGAYGSLTDGGAINTLTEEEIAVAAAKGWTVSYS